MYATGSTPEFGAMETANAVNLPWGMGDNWAGTVQVPVGTEVQFKTANAVNLPWGVGGNWSGAVQVPVGTEVQFKLFKMSNTKDVEWESEKSRTFKAMEYENGYTATCTWGDVESMKIEMRKLSTLELMSRSVSGKVGSMLEEARKKASEDTALLVEKVKEYITPEQLEEAKKKASEDTMLLIDKVKEYITPEQLEEAKKKASEDTALLVNKKATAESKVLSDRFELTATKRKMGSYLGYKLKEAGGCTFSGSLDQLAYSCHDAMKKATADWFACLP
eukprot:gene7470-612_t